MITLLLWICPFTWPLAFMRMRRKRDQRLAAMIRGEQRRRSPLGWLAHTTWTKLHGGVES